MHAENTEVMVNLLKLNNMKNTENLYIIDALA